MFLVGILLWFFPLWRTVTCIICWCRSKTGVRSLSHSVQSFLTAMVMIRLVFTSQNECFRSFFLTVLMVCTVSKCTKLFPYWWTATIASSRLSLMSFLLGIASTNWSETRHRNVFIFINPWLWNTARQLEILELFWMVSLVLIIASIRSSELLSVTLKYI